MLVVRGGVWDDTRDMKRRKEREKRTCGCS
jgi:hypothetical protein